MTLARPLVVLGHLWLLIVVAQAAAVPVQDTMVVSKFDETTDAILSDPTPTPSSSTDPTTEEHTPSIKLLEMDIKSTISMRYAHTAVVARVKNPAKRAQEANFRVLLPETAFISGFVMTIDGKSYKAYVKEKEEAKHIYQDAVTHGFGAAHIAAKARDSNHFTVTVNVEAASTAIFNLTYEELLNRRIDVYNHAITCQPGSLVPKFTVTVYIKETANITELRVPEIRTGNEVDATKSDAQMSNVIIKREGASAEIIFSPDLEEQKRLMQIYAEKSKESATGQTDGEGVLGQFVVQYDVDRSSDGQILVNDGYFVHFFAPNLPPLNKYVVFVLDTSGSMMGRKIEQLQQAMQTILNELNPGDYFSIVDFDSTVSVHDLSEADKEPPKRQYYYNDAQQPLNLVEPYQATSDNIEKARVIISRLDAFGGTNIGSALNVAVDLINKYAGNGQQNSNSSSTTTVATPTSEDTAIAETSKSEKTNEVKHKEPIIIFLTDGDATVGETNTKTIINHFTEKNYGENKAATFCLGLGDDADHKFLRKLSLRNEGFSRHIYEASDTALQLRDFYRQVSSPLLANVKFVYAADQVDEETTTKHKFRSFYAGSELVVAGRIANTATELDAEVHGWCGVKDDGYTRKKFDKKIKIPVPVEKNEYYPLERLWAYLTIKQLLDEKDASDTPDEDKKKENSPEKKALALALKYEFVTPLTSLVVVKPNETSAVNAESVDKLDTHYQYQPVSIPYRGQAGAAFSYASPIGSYDISGMVIDRSALISNGFPAYRGQAVPMSSYASHAYPSSLLSNRAQYSSYWGPAASHQLFMSPLQAVSLNSYGDTLTADADYEVDEEDGPNPQPLDAGDLPQATRRVFSHRHKTNPISVILTTPFIPPMSLDPSLSSTTPPPGLGTYHLESFGWTASLLNFSSDSIVLQTNETVTLNLTRDSQAPKASAGDVNCSNAVAGGDGLCVYLTRCDEAREITADLYKTNYCIVDGGYAGVCCHKNKIDLTVVR